jgi:hypothetical protein
VSITAAAGFHRTVGDARYELGPKRAYRLREAITLAAEEEWQCVLQSLRSSAGDFGNLAEVNVASE